MIAKPSNATIVRPSATHPIYATEYANPEEIMPAVIRDYLIGSGFNSMYPNFANVRVGATHPFAVLLYQEITNTKLDLDVFPSITVNDSDDSESDQFLSSNLQQAMFGVNEIAAIAGRAGSGALLISSSNLAALQTAVASGSTIATSKLTIISGHTIDINIWADNKKVTRVLYDLVKHAIKENMDSLRTSGIDITGPVGGRPSGDVNLDFGSMLFGANVTVQATIITDHYTFDLPVGTITTIDTNPTFLEV